MVYCIIGLVLFFTGRRRSPCSLRGRRHRFETQTPLTCFAERSPPPVEGRSW